MGEAMFYAACGVVLGLYACVGSSIHELTLAYDRFLYHHGEAKWGLIYVAPAAAKEIRLSLLHFKRDAAGHFVQDQVVNYYDVGPPEPKQKFLVRLDYSPDHTHLFCEKNSSPGKGIPLPKNHLFEKHPLKIADGVYILWLGTRAAPPVEPTLENASEYLALQVEADLVEAKAAQ